MKSRTKNGTETADGNQKCKVVSFYSFKGGVGRSLALINTAFRLSGLGFKVLMVDMDLEAPGLINKNGIYEKIADPDKKNNKGVKKGFLELFMERDSDVSLLTKIRENAYSVAREKDGKGPIDLLNSGNFTDGQYWKDLHETDHTTANNVERATNLSEFVKNIIAACEAQYDYLLFDLRAGMTPFGMAVLQSHFGDPELIAPDGEVSKARTLVYVFVKNRENLLGIQMFRRLMFEKYNLDILPRGDSASVPVHFVLSRLHRDETESSEPLKDMVVRINTSLNDINLLQNLSDPSKYKRPECALLSGDALCKNLTILRSSEDMEKDESEAEEHGEVSCSLYGDYISLFDAIVDFGDLIGKIETRFSSILAVKESGSPEEFENSLFDLLGMVSVHTNRNNREKLEDLTGIKHGIIIQAVRESDSFTGENNRKKKNWLFELLIDRLSLVKDDVQVQTWQELEKEAGTYISRKLEHHNEMKKGAKGVPRLWETHFAFIAERLTLLTLTGEKKTKLYKNFADAVLTYDDVNEIHRHADEFLDCLNMDVDVARLLLKNYRVNFDYLNNDAAKRQKMIDRNEAAHTIAMEENSTSHNKSREYAFYVYVKARLDGTIDTLLEECSDRDFFGDARLALLRHMPEIFVGMIGREWYSQSPVREHADKKIKSLVDLCSKLVKQIEEEYATKSDHTNDRIKDRTDKLGHSLKPILVFINDIYSVPVSRAEDGKQFTLKTLLQDNVTYQSFIRSVYELTKDEKGDFSYIVTKLSNELP